MRRHYIQSSVFKSAGYDEQAKVLELEFKETGDVWHYWPLSKKVFDKLIKSDSPGHFFSTEIRDKYHEEQVRS